MQISRKGAKAQRVLGAFAPWREILIAFAFLCAPVLADEPAETIRYLRPGGKGFVREATFTLRHEKNGWAIESLTERDDTKMTVRARYDEMDRLLSAGASLRQKNQKDNLSAGIMVQIDDGKAKVRDIEFDTPPGTIVTSAPDWTDIFLLCRKYDAKKGGKQTFPGLWIHPTQPAQCLKFTIERTGKDGIDHDGKRIELSRFRIQIRGPTPYQAWADDKGTLVKLMPGGVVRAGFEETTRELGAQSKK